MSRGDAFSCSWTLRIPFSFSFSAGVIEVDSLVCTCHLPFWPLCHFSPLKPSTGFTLLTILHPTDFYDFSAGLSEHRSPEEKAGIVDELFKHCEIQRIMGWIMFMPSWLLQRVDNLFDTCFISYV